MAASNINGNHGGVVAAPGYDTSFAAQPADLDAVPGLLNDIAFLKGNYNLDLSANREARLYLLGKARSLVQALESPRETMLKHCGAEVCLLTPSHRVSGNRIDRNMSLADSLLLHDLARNRCRSVSLPGQGQRTPEEGYGNLQGFEL
jgi:hypothetical protein